MGYLLPQRNVLAVALFCLLAWALVACAPDPQAQLISPDMAPIAAGEEFVPPTPTPVPDLAALSDEEIVAGLPEEVLAAFPGDPANGQELSVLNGCTGCHQLDPDNVAVAPSWYNIGNVAITRDPDVGPATYLYESIVNPNQYIVEGYNANIMPQTYEEALSVEQLTDIVSYLLTLRGDATE